MKNTVKINSIELFNADCLDVLSNLEENSVDLIVTDPPYFKVKTNSWDNQWSGDAEYLAWLDRCLVEFWRVLKPAGSLYLFCGHRLSADTEILIRNRFNVLNHIVWAKPSGPWNLQHKESLRSYFPATERIIFAEHYPGPYQGKDTGYQSEISGLKQAILSPLISYFRDAKKSLGITNGQIAEATGKKNMPSHWFGLSQWMLPAEDDYIKLQTLFDGIARDKKITSPLEKEHGGLVKSYQSLNREYQSLIAEYKNLRRPFSVSVDVPFTDVWTHKSVQYYPGKHPCEKPAEMLMQIIEASSRPGDLVADFFMGSGSTLKAASVLGRRSLGVEMEQSRFSQTVREIQDLQNNNSPAE